MSSQETDPQGNPTPPFEQIRQQLTDEIRSGNLEPGHKLPSVRQLAGDLRIAAESASVRKNAPGSVSGAQVAWFRKSRSCTSQNLPVFAAHIATSAATAEARAGGGLKDSGRSRHRPVAPTSRRLHGLQACVPIVARGTLPQPS